MQRTLLSLALAASLLLNGCFIGGYWYAGHKTAQLQTHTKRLAAVVAKLDLAANQAALFKQLKRKAGRIRKQYRQKAGLSRKRLWQKLAGDPDNLAGNNRLVHEMMIQQEAYQREIVTIIAHFVSGLNAEQRRTFLRLSADNKTLRALLSG